MCSLLTRPTLGAVLAFMAPSCLLPCAPVSAATIEISPPQSFEAAVESLAPGDTLVVHQGTYTDTGRISITVVGTAALPVVITGAEGEARPVITRTGAVQNTINIEGAAAYITIRRLEITGNGGDGIKLNGNNSFITLEDLDIHDVDVGIGMQTNVNHLTIRRNHIWNTGRDNGTGEGMYIGCNFATCAVSNSLIEGNWVHDSLPGTTQGDGIEIKVGSYGNIIRDNVVYNRAYPGILVYGTGANPVNVVEGNVVWNSLEGISALADAIVRNNIVLNSGCGLCVYTHEQVSQYKNLTLVNNTLYNNDDGVYFRWLGSNLILANNAIYSPGKRAVNSNGVIGSTGGAVASNYMEGAMVGDAIDGSRFLNGGSSAAAFVNAPGSDLWPKAGSVLIGTANAPFAAANDFNGTVRVVPVDVGAYETEGLATNPGWPIGPGFKQVGAQGSGPPAPPQNVRVR